MSQREPTGTGPPARHDETTSSMLTVALLVLLAGLTAAALVTVTERSSDAAAAEAAERANATAVAVVAGMAEAARVIESAARIDADLAAVGREVRGAARLPTLTAVEYVPVGRQHAVNLPAGLLGSQPIERAMADARDSRRVVVSGPIDQLAGAVALVRARYDGDPGSAPPGSTAARRASVSGFIVGLVDVPALVGNPDAEVTDAGRLLSGPRLDGSTGVAAPVLDRQWSVAVPVAAGDPGPVWFLALLGGAAVGLALISAWSWRGLARSRAAEAEAALDQAGAVVTYAGVVQESHDLAEVLPALAVQLSDRLGLAGMSLSTAQENGALREVFAHGEVPDRSVTATTAPPESAEPGQTVAIHLRRAERSIGVLRVRCGRPLGVGDLDQLRIVAELVTSTVVASRSMDQQREAVDRLRSLDELKTAFLETASHELRTPVTAISGFAYMLSDRWEALSDDQRKVFADRIASNARVLDALVQDLLDFARLERGALRLALEPVDLAAVVERVLDRLEPVWSSHTVARAVEPGATVVGDAPALERVVTNLVTNAVKFSPEGSVVAVRIEDGDPVRLSIDDEGPGVPTADRDRIFVRFFRGGGDAVVRTSGVGIGLAVVKDYITQMGGEISVETSPAGGARFVVELAAATQQPDDRRERSDVTT